MQPIDWTMFGGMRGKFNAMNTLRDRDERQRTQGGGGRRMQRDGGGRGLSDDAKEEVRVVWLPA